MRQSALFATTLRQSPADAEAASHRLLLRAGFIRQLAAGIYAYLPLGRRVLAKIEGIVREEMDRTGAQEMLLTALQPAELWQASGRYDVYGPELVRLRDRHDREFALGPTHEEAITALVKHDIRSYRRLPFTVYQIQTKFRDERRPRSGLLRGREFLMKDAYSFDTSWEGVDRSYRRMYEAYTRIFERCGLRFRAVEADPGAIGGEGGTHEFVALAEAGEDTIASCTRCGYSANLEKAEAGLPEEDAGGTAEAEGRRGANAEAEVEAAERIHTPGIRTIEQLTSFLGIEPRHVIKTLLYVADGQPVAVLVRGDHEANETKLLRALNAEQAELADADTVASVTGAPPGFAGPIGLGIPILVDEAVARMPSGVCGANEADYHVRGAVPGRDFAVHRAGDFRNVREGDRCPRCGQGELRLGRGIEVGHVFKLGTKYSEALGASFLDAEGRERPLLMGCYGIGVSRLLAAIVEQRHDDKGIVWPAAIAPYRAHIVPVSARDDTQVQVAERLYEELARQGIEALLEDRDERAGVKFNDADLIGIPFRIVVGKQAGEGLVEYTVRADGEKRLLTVEEAIARIRAAAAAT